MLGPQRLLADGEAALEERLGLGVAALGLVKQGEVVERRLPVMVCSGPSAFSRMARLRLYKRLGLGVAALLLVQPGQVVERRGDSRVLGPQRLLTDARLRL